MEVTTNTQMIELILYDRFAQEERPTGITREGWPEACEEADRMRETHDKSRYGLTLRPVEIDE